MDHRTFFETVLHIHDARLLDALLPITSSLHLKKGQVLIKEGDCQVNFPFLDRGIFRGYYTDVNGHEITDCLGFQSGTPAMSIAITDDRSPITIEALTDCDFIQLSGPSLLPLVDNSVQLLKVYNNILHTALKVHRERTIILSQKSAPERYQWFLKAYPGLIDRISHKTIASFLCMTPVTLSRLRRTIDHSP